MKKDIYKNASIVLVVLLIIGSTIYSFLRPQTPTPTVEVIEETIRNYLQEHPEEIIQALQKHQENEQAQQHVNAQAAVIENYEAIVNDGHSAVLGNPEGDVTVVEFFDYLCGYCKHVFPAVARLIEEDKNVRVVMKEYPILGVQSAIAAKAALAVHMIAPEKYLAFHQKLLEGRVTGEDFVLAAAAELGLDKAAVKAKMDSDEVMKAIEANIALAHKIGVNGTPGFIIGKTLVPGAIEYEVMQSLVGQARDENAKEAE